MFKKKKIFLVFFVLSCFFALELSSRLLFHFLSWDIKAYQGQGGRYQPEPFRSFGLKPGYQINHFSLKETINSHGFKSPEFKIKKSDDIYRIVVLGGSSVYGSYDNEMTWPKLLNDHLNQKINTSFNKSFEVINTGVPGYNTFHSLSLLINNIIEYNPDLIILYQMWNDISYWPHLNDSTIYKGTLFKSDKNILNNSYLFTSIRVLTRVFLGNLTNEKFIDSYNSNEKKVSIDNGLERYRKNIEIMALICSNYNIPLIISSQLSLLKENNSKEELRRLTKINHNFQFYFDALKKGNDVLVDISKRYQKNTFYYNPENNIKTNPDLMRDHIHPTKKGNSLLSTDIGNYIFENIITRK